MRIPYYHVDAFTSARFAGNPAGVCVLQAWLPAGTLQKIGAENNLSETAFIVARPDHFELRWFTPTLEVDLCGHATLATAHVIFSYWENLDGQGGAWQEHAIFDANLGGHAAVVRDVTGNGLLDIIAKPWHPRPGNAVGGGMFVVFLENLGS